MGGQGLAGLMAGCALSRRELMGRAGGLAAGTALGLSARHGAGAQSASGQIAVQFESRGGVVQQHVEGVIGAITTGNSGATITIIDPPAGDYMTELTLALTSDEAPDVFAVNSVIMGQLAGMGAIMPLDPFLAGWPDWEQFPAVVKDNLLFQGSTWGLPYSVDTHFLYYRKDLFRAAGLPDSWQPRALADITAAARAVKQTAPDVIPLVLFAGANPGNSTVVRGFLPLLRAFGGTLRDADGKWIIDSCPIREALGYYELVYQTEALVPQSVMTSINASGEMRTAFAMGQAAIMFDGSWVWDDWSAALPDISQTIGYTLFPTADGSSPLTIGGFGVTWFINARTAYPELAWAFVSRMMGKDVLISINLDDPHIPPRLDSIADPGFQNGGFEQAMVESIDAAAFIPPDPAYRELVGIVQHATGIIATGESTAFEAVQRYRDELSRILGNDRVVSQACQ